MSEEDNKEFFELFVEEGNYLIDDAESKMHALSTQGGAFDENAVNTVFRMFHSLKGSAGFLNFKNIQKITHEAETLLDLFRMEKRQPTPQEMDLLYQTADFLRQLVMRVSEKLTDEGSEEQSDIIINDIKTSIDNFHKHDGGASTKAVRVESESIAPDEALKLRFMQECFDLIDKMEIDTIALEKNPSDAELVNSIFRGAHTIKGNCGFMGYGALEEAAAEFEMFLEVLRAGRSVVNDNVIKFFLSQIDHLKEMVFSLSSNNAGYKPLGVLLVEKGAVSRAEVDEALRMQQAPLGEILVESGKVSADVVSEVLESQKKLVKENDQKTAGMQRREIRVSTEKLDKLFDLVGELITAEQMALHHPDVRKIKDRGYRKAVGYLDKITRELQEVTMSVRMIPLDGLFSRAQRVVHDLVRKCGKRVELILTGSETEMDRNLIEEIADPLVHLLRNSIDHGIEDAADREAAGKKPEGRIELEAKYEGNEIWITVKDDGGGLDRMRILARARERGIITNDGSTLTDEQVWNFVFEPGFSTRETVSDLSGRGVGMDVVKKNMDKLRGKVEIISTKGKGSSFILRIPLTMAILEAITARVGKSHFSIPSLEVLEFFRADAKQIVELQGGEQGVRLRDEVLPILRLGKLFHIAEAKNNLAEGIMLVVRHEGRKACLFIDEIIGNQQVVIKSLSNYLGRVRGVTGCSILGSGEISLILDAGGLIKTCLAA